MVAMDRPVCVKVKHPKLSLIRELLEQLDWWSCSLGCGLNSLFTSGLAKIWPGRAGVLISAKVRYIPPCHAA